ncbi:MAG: PspA/IM30 family protein [Prochlorotrichaceae cyanobacterium]
MQQIFSRFFQTVRANWSHWTSQNQDPEVLLEQAIQILQDEMIQLRQAVAQAIATYKRTERQYRQTQERSEDWYAQAERAMAQQQEGEAREALTQRKILLDASQVLAQQLGPQQQIIQRLKQDLRSLELKLADARTRKDLYLVRARSAQATQRMNELLGKLQSNTGGLFEKMEDRVVSLESQASASTDLQNLPTDPLEAQFKALEDGPDDIENELADLRQRFS